MSEIDRQLAADLLELISCDELAELLRCCSTTAHKLLIVDCRSFLEFNTGNIVNSVSVCCSKLVKRRLQQNKVPITEFLSQACHVDVDSDHEIVLYDQCTASADVLAEDNLVVILARRCRDVFRRVRLLAGGFLEFQALHPLLCETKSVLTQAGIVSGGANFGHGGVVAVGEGRGGFNSPLSSGMSTSLSQPCLPVANVGPTKILPYLFLGSQQDAMSTEQAQVNGITYVLNVSLSCPKPPHIQDGHFLRIPVNDSYSEKLLPHFHEAFQFLDKVRESGGRVLVHCLAGISRSPTLAIAYIMRCYHMTSEEAYRYVKERRPTISPNFNFLGQLLEYERQIEAEKSIAAAAVAALGGGSNKRRCLDDLRASATCTTPATPVCTGASPECGCANDGQNPLLVSSQMSPVTSTADAAASSAPAELLPTPQPQRAEDGCGSGSRYLSRVVKPSMQQSEVAGPTHAVHASSATAAAAAAAVLPPTLAQQLPPATAAAAVLALQFTPSSPRFKIGGVGDSGAQGGGTSRPKQLGFGLTLLSGLSQSSGLPHSLSQESPSAAMANLSFESSLPASNSPPPLPSTSRHDFTAPDGGLDVSAPVRLRHYPTASLSQLNFTPCLVARSAACSLPSRQTDELAALVGSENCKSTVSTVSSDVLPAVYREGAVCRPGACSTTVNSLARSRRQAMSLNLIPSVLTTPLSSASVQPLPVTNLPLARDLSSLEPPAIASSQQLHVPLGTVVPPGIAVSHAHSVSADNFRSLGEPGFGVGELSSGLVKAASASPELVRRTWVIGGAAIGLREQAGAGSTPSHGASDFVASVGEPLVLETAGKTDLRETRLIISDLSQPKPMFAVSHQHDSTHRSDVSSAAFERASLQQQLDASVEGSTDSRRRLNTEGPHHSAPQSNTDSPSATSSSAVMCVVSPASALRLPTAHTVPSDLRSLLTVANEARSVQSRTSCAVGGEMPLPPHRKSRSLEDILTSPDWEAATIGRTEAKMICAASGDGGRAFGSLFGSSTTAASSSSLGLGGACRCLRRRSALLVFSSGESGGCTNVSLAASPHERCRCGAAAVALSCLGGDGGSLTAATSMVSARDSGSLPRPSSGSIASTSSSGGGSRTTSVHSSLEMIQVS